VKNIFPGGTVANISLSGKPYMNKPVGVEISAVDAYPGADCPDDPDGPYETAEAVILFTVTDVNGKVLSNGVPRNVTCVSGVDSPFKTVVTFGPDSCGVGGFQEGVFDITTSVTGTAGENEKIQRMRCRP
jgi:hypothetical protein